MYFNSSTKKNLGIVSTVLNKWQYGLLTYWTYDAWALCRQMKLEIKFLYGTSDAKIQNPVPVTYVNYLRWDLWR